MFNKITKNKWFLPVIIFVILIVATVIGIFVSGITDAYFTDNDKGGAFGDSGKTGVSLIAGESSFADTVEGVDAIDTIYWGGVGELNFTIQNNENIALDAQTTITLSSSEEQAWDEIAPLIEIYDKKYVTIENDNYVLSNDAIPLKSTKKAISNGVQWTLSKDVLSGSDTTAEKQIRWVNSEGKAISNSKYLSLTAEEQAAYTLCGNTKIYDFYFCFHESGGADITMEVNVHTDAHKQGNKFGWKISDEFKKYGRVMPRANILEAGTLFNAHLTELAGEEEVKEVVFTASDLANSTSEPSTYSVKRAITNPMSFAETEEKVLPVCPGVTIPSEGTIDVSHYKNKSILAWNDNGTVYVASVNGDVVYANWDCSNMFNGHSELEKIRFINFDISEYTTDLSNMFSRCTGLVMLDFSGWDMSGITNMDNMFNMVPNYSCNLKAIYVNNTWDVEKVKNACSTHIGSGLSNLIGQTGVYDGGTTQWGYVEAGSFNYENGILVYFDGDPNSLVAGHHFNSLIPSTATELYIGDYHESIPTDKSKWIDFSISQDYAVIGWLDGTKLYITSQDGSEINTSGSMYKMFAHSSSSDAALTTISIKNVNSTDAFNGSHLFYNQTALANLDIKELDTDNMTSMYMMFYNCDALTELDCTIFNTSNVTNMSHMFYSCGSLTRLLVSDLDVSNVTDMSYMFNDCSKLTMLNLSGWDTSSMVNTSYMFGIPVGGGSSILNTIYVGDLWTTEKMTNHSNMFNVTPVLVGQSGINPYSSDGTGANYQTGVLTYYDGSPNTLIAGPSFRAAVPNTATAVYIGDYHESIPEDKSTWIDLSITQDYSVLGWLDGTTFYVTSQDGSEINTSGSVYQMFAYENSNNASLSTISLKNINTANTSNFANMFYNQTKLATLDINEIETPKANNMKFMFYNCTALKSLDLKHFNTSNVTNMYYMFGYCSALASIDVSSFDVSNVTNLSYMFTDCSALTVLNLSTWELKSATTINYMFQRCTALTTIYAEDWSQYGSIVNADRTFFVCWSLSGAIKYNSNVTADLPNCNYLTGYFTKYSNVHNALLGGMQFNAKVKNTNTIQSIVFTDTVAEGFTYTDVSEAQDGSVVGWLDGTTYYIASVDGEKIFVHPVANNMFYSWSNIANFDFTNLSFEYVESAERMFQYCANITQNTVLEINLPKAKTIKEMFSGVYGFAGTINAPIVTDASMLFYNCQNATVIDISGLSIPKVKNISEMFRYCYKITTMDLSALNTSNVTDMHSLFYECQKLANINFTNFDTSKVADMSYMFYKCNALTELDVSNFDMSSVTNTNYMFGECTKLVTIYAEDWTDVTTPTNSTSMFSSCTALSGSVVYNSSYTTWNMANTKTGYFTAKPELTTNMLMSGANFNSIIPSNATSVIFTDAVADGVTTTDLSALGDGSVVGWTIGTTYYVATVDGSKIIAHPSMARTFYNKTSLTTVDFTNLDTLKVVNMSHLFYGCSALQTFDASLLDTSNIKNMGYMFYSCIKLKTVDLNVLDTSNVLEMSYMFYNSGFETLNLKDWDVSSLIKAQYMFGNIARLTHLDLSNWVLPVTIKDTNYMFYGCSKLYYIYAGDWSSQTYNGLSSNNMFYDVGAASEFSSKNISIANPTTGCFTTHSTESNVLMRGYAFNQYVPSAATSVVFDSTLAVPTDVSLVDLSETRDESVVGWLDGTTFYISTVDNGTLYLNADSSKMFYQKNNIVTVDMGDADASKATNMSYMFYYCPALTTVKASGLDVSNVTDMSYMFQNCSQLKDCAIGDWDVSNVQKFDYMFYYCSALTTLDLGGWTPTSAKTTTCMFYDCSNLVTIYAQDWTPMTTPTNSRSMFYCQKLVGAVSYNSSYTDWSMANTETGYFTTKVNE